jgi:acyl-CoA thioesterase
VTVTVEVVRSGRTVTTATARLEAEGKPRLVVLTAWGDLTNPATTPADASMEHRGPTAITLRPPALPPPEECVRPSELSLPDDGPRSPDASSIRSRVDVRIDPSADWWRREGATSYAGWIRFADDRPLDAQCLPLLVDAFPPAVFGALEAQWVPTVELTVHVRAVPTGTWLAGRVSTRCLMDNRFDEDCELWDERGRLVAMSRQLAQVLAPPG